ncbi:uncharacterized protein LOC133854505 [Alnus glutinosa]|jgi:hypothetical protein|uniref:uncharacterized protein LOC133854505 n=1 Tax=Alnus glutinosa TaxID=3517 RepID=UPI002D772F92|nr:uncharacterized protein LOC133854505 [Alnus glutinosa]
MGNCMETCEKRQETEDQEMQQQQQQQGYDERERSSASPFVKESGFEKGSIRLKIVLTKEELEWFMLQLKDKEGKRLEDVFREIERQRGRGKVEAWKPSLESIMESPEVIEMER